MKTDPTEQLISLIGIAIFFVISWVLIAKRERQLDDPNDDSVVYLDQLDSVSNLGADGRYLVRILRQSGNLQKDDQIFSSRDSAIKAAVSTFKRAKIEYVVIDKNTQKELFFRRPYWRHGRNAEGKKVGSVEIYMEQQDA